MDPIMANEVAGQTPKKDDQTDSKQYLFIFKNNTTMNKFMELVKEFGKADKLTKENVDAITTAYNELPAEDKNNRLKATFESIIEKFDEETPEDPKKDDEPELDADGNPIVKATETKDVTIKANEYNELKKAQSDYAKMVKEVRKNNITSEVNKLVFSETEKTGIFTAKESAKIVEFISSLSEVQEKKFFEIMATVKSDLKKFTEELGSGASKELGKTPEDVEARTTQIMSENKTMKRSEAMRIAMKECNASTASEIDTPAKVK